MNAGWDLPYCVATPVAGVTLVAPVSPGPIGPSVRELESGSSPEATEVSHRRADKCARSWSAAP